MATSTHFTEEIISNPYLVTDAAWQWYTRVVGLGETVEVSLSYSGDLDLDLRLYWTRDNFPGFYGFDLSHCPINSSNYVYEQTSQFRTTNTSLIGQPEELYFLNDRYTKQEDKEAYVLVFAYSGIGKSTFTLTSTLPLTRIPDDLVYDCQQAFNMLLLYAGISGGIAGVGILFIYRKKNKLIKPEIEKDKFEKREKKEEREVIDLDSIAR